MNCLIPLQNNWVWRERSTHHHTGLNQMVTLRVFHNFLKACLFKHIFRNREWDDVTLLATASYNWLPNQHSRESPFFIMFGRVALTNLQHLIKPKLRYMGTSELILDLEIMSNIYQVQIHNLKLARQ